MYNYYYGCPCDNDSNFNLANKEFDNISNSEECILNGLVDEIKLIDIFNDN
jgi:hypothetical protein